MPIRFLGLSGWINFIWDEINSIYARMSFVLGCYLHQNIICARMSFCHRITFCTRMSFCTRENANWGFWLQTRCPIVVFMIFTSYLPNSYG